MDKLCDSKENYLALQEKLLSFGNMVGVFSIYRAKAKAHMYFITTDFLVLVVLSLISAHLFSDFVHVYTLPAFDVVYDHRLYFW